MASFPAAQLQRIADGILAPVAMVMHLAPADEDLFDVEYAKGQVVRVPRWLLTHRGKDLMGAFQTAFPNESGGFGVAPLLRPFEKVGMVPRDLADVLRALRRGEPPPLAPWRSAAG